MNTPPFLLHERTLPAPGVDPIDADIGDGCATETFRATPVDFDGGVLSFKWLLVGRLGLQNQGRVLTRRLTGGSLNPTDASLDEVLPGAADAWGDGAWYQGLELTLTRDALGGGFDSPSSLVGADKTHLLSVFVSDHSFGQDPLNTVPVVGPDEPAQSVASATWQIRILETDCPVLVP